MRILLVYVGADIIPISFCGRPKVGELVLASTRKNVVELSYRAVVAYVDGEKKEADVLFVDYGNIKVRECSKTVLGFATKVTCSWPRYRMMFLRAGQECLMGNAISSVIL